MRVAAAQLPSQDDSDDKLFTTPNAVIMLDGASAFVPVPIAASTYAEQLGRHIRARLTERPDADLADVLAAAIEATAGELALSPGESPSSTVAIARVRRDTVDLLVLGDTEIVTPHETIRDDRLAQLALAPHQKYRDRLAAGGGYDNEHRRILRELQAEQAQHRNRDRGYWIAEAAPEAAHHAVVSEHAEDVTPWLVLATDGAYKTMAHLGLDDWPNIAHASEQQLDAILARCREWEQQHDPDGRDLPRAKRHDDKCLAAAQLA